MADPLEASDLDASRRIEASAKDIMNILQNFPHNSGSPRGTTPRKDRFRGSPRRRGSRTPGRGGSSRAASILALSSSSSSSSDDDDLYATTIGHHDKEKQLVESKAHADDAHSGFVDLDILINNAFRAMQDHITSGVRFGAALLTRAGRVFTACQTEGLGGSFVPAERTAILKAVSEGFMEYEKLVLCNDQTVGFPMPDNHSLQMLAAYGNFTICVVNATRTYQEFQSQELWKEYKDRLANSGADARRFAAQPSSQAAFPHSSTGASEEPRLNKTADAFLKEKYESLKDSKGIVSIDDAKKFLNESRDHVKDLNSSLNFDQFKQVVADGLDKNGVPGHQQSTNSHSSTHGNVQIRIGIGETVQQVLRHFESRGDDATSLIVGKHDRKIITCFSKPGSNYLVVTGLAPGSTTFEVTDISGGSTMPSRRYVLQSSCLTDTLSCAGCHHTLFSVSIPVPPLPPTPPRLALSSTHFVPPPKEKKKPWQKYWHRSVGRNASHCSTLPPPSTSASAERP